MLWREECVCPPATLIGPSKVYWATRPLSLWKGCGSMRQSDAFLFQGELSMPSLCLLASQMHKHFDARVNEDLLQGQAETSLTLIQVRRSFLWRRKGSSPIAGRPYAFRISGKL